MRSSVVRTFLAICVAASCVAALPGCAATGQSSEEAQAQADNRQYMSRVNQLSMDIADSLSDFEAAVQAEDLSAMRAASNEASRIVGELSSLEAPDALADVKTGYSDGATELQGALDDFVALYADVEAGSVDAATYEQRRADIQARYDAALEKISQTDELAASL